MAKLPADQEFVDSQSGTYVQTDINGVSPKNYAGVGYKYDEDLNGFIPPNEASIVVSSELNSDQKELVKKAIGLFENKDSFFHLCWGPGG